MGVYQEAAKTFGDDNFIFLVYDDPALLTPAGLERVTELAAAVAPDRIPAVQRVESLDAMPLLWSIDDALLALDRLPKMARNLASNAAKRAVKNVDLKTSSMTVAGAVRAAAADQKALAALKDRLTKHPLFLGTLIDATGTTTAVIARMKKTHQHNVIETVAEVRRIADEFAARHQLGPAGRRRSAGSLVRRVRGDRGRRPPTGGGRHDLDRRGHPLGRSEPLVGDRADARRLGGVAGYRGDIDDLQYQAVTLRRPPGGPDHRADDARGQPPGDPLSRRTPPPGRPAPGGPLDPGRGRGADRLDGDHRRDRLCGARHQRRGADPAIRRDPRIMHVRRGDPGHADLANRHAAAVSPGNSRPPRLALAGGRIDEPPDPDGLPPSRRDRLGVFAIVLPLAIGMFRLSYETNYINLFRPETRVVKDYFTVESRLGGIGLVELVVPVGKSLSPDSLHDLKVVEDRIRAIRVSDPNAIAQVLSLATVLDPDGRLAALPKERQDRTLADKLELIAASPQNDLLRSFWNADTGQTRILIRMKEQMPAPDKSRIFREATAAGAQTFGPTTFLTGLSFLMTRTTEAIIATQWGTFLWSAIGILLMLTLAFRSLILAMLAITPTLLVGRPGARPDGLAQDPARHGDRAGGERRPGAFGRRHVSLPAAVPPPAEEPVSATTLRELPRERTGGVTLQPGGGHRLCRAPGQRVRAVHQFRDHGRDRNRRQHAGQSGLAPRVLDAGRALAAEQKAARGGRWQRRA